MVGRRGEGGGSFLAGAVVGGTINENPKGIIWRHRCRMSLEFREFEIPVG